MSQYYARHSLLSGNIHDVSKTGPISIIRLKVEVAAMTHLIVGFPPPWLWFNARSGNVVYVVDNIAFGRGFLEYLCFPSHFSFHLILHTPLSSGAGTVGPVVADVASGFSHSTN
jgi:hypothetical protein